jgi:hypothetical protein
VANIILINNLEALIETAELLQIPELLTDVAQARKEYQHLAFKH